MHIRDTTDGVRFDEETATYRAVHDWEGDRPVYLTVAAAVARATGDDATDVEPLAERIDPEALDALFRPLRERRSRTPTESGAAPGTVGEPGSVDPRGDGDETAVAGGDLGSGVRTPTPTVEFSRRTPEVARAEREEYVQFVVADCRVTVTWDGVVVATPPGKR